MGDSELSRCLMELGAGVEACLERKLITPGLVLLYSAIDITSWLGSDEPNAPVRERFVAWVEQYLLRGKALKCTALELYSARCGLVHTLTAESTLVVEGKARRIVYAWGSAKSEDLQRLIEMMKRGGDDVAVQFEELYEAWKLGVLAFTKDLQTQPGKARIVYERARKLFANVAVEEYQSLLDRNDVRP